LSQDNYPGNIHKKPKSLSKLVMAHLSGYIKERVVKRNQIRTCSIALFLCLMIYPALSAQDQANILFIMSDDHSFRAIGAYNEVIEAMDLTPHIDQLAKEGAMFTNSVCTNSLCAPSRASIITGMYSHWNGVYTLREDLNGEYLPTLAKELKKVGYNTAAVGKWHIEGDNLQGYDYYAITHGQGNYWNPTMTTKGDKLSKTGYTTDVYTDVAMDWLDSRDKSAPFFLMVHQKATHGPWHYDTIKYKDFLTDIEIPEPANLLDDYANRNVNGVPNKQHKLHDLQDPETTNKDLLMKNFLKPDWATGSIDTSGMTDVEIVKACYQKYMHDYLICVKSVDDNVGRIVQKLSDDGILENTIIIYTSDQGMFLGEHNFYDKRLGLEEAMRIPLIMRYPQKVAQDTIIADIVNVVDFAPTFLDIAGAGIPEEMQGISFKDLMYGNTPDTIREASFYHFYSSSCPKHIGLRTKDYKLLMYLGKKRGDLLGYDLYDLVNDPYEMNNVFEDIAYADVAAMMQEKLDKEMESIGFTEGLYPGKDQKNTDRRVVFQLKDQEGEVIRHGKIRFNEVSDHEITENGYVSVFNVLPETYAVNVDAAGFELLSASISIEPRPNYKQSNDTLISFDLAAIPYTIDLTVSDQDGPVSGATVSVDEGSFTTGESGDILLNGLFRGQYIISIEADGYESLIDTVEIIDSNLTLDYVLNKASLVFDHDFGQVKIYPNPASETFTVDGGKVGQILRICNMAGVLLKEEIIDSEQKIVHVEDLVTGSYLLSLDGEFSGLIQVKK
jgi:arylsulfatase A-like enzyme